MRVIPPKGSIPPNIRSKPGVGRISFGLNIGAFGLGGLNQTQKQQSDFKIKSKQGRPQIKKKISIEGLKGWFIEELACLMELEKYKKGLEHKKQWLIEQIPPGFLDEILEAAKKLSGEGR